MTEVQKKKTFREMGGVNEMKEQHHLSQKQELLEYLSHVKLAI